MTEYSSNDLTTPTATHDAVRASGPSVLAGSAVCVALTLSCVLALALRPALPAGDALRTLWPIGALLGPFVAAYKLGDVWHRGVVAATYSAVTGVAALLGLALAYRSLTHAFVGLPWAFTAATYVVPVFALGAVVGGVAGSWLRDCTNFFGDDTTPPLDADAPDTTVTITILDVEDASDSDAAERSGTSMDDTPGPRARDDQAPPTPGACDTADDRRRQNG
ncbi:hypothetical protein [Halarchaeum sp. P4]|uniref:hypothetical protein n=1 Tax=Halarchaeum sp. P4 TaxID=3421639 RepID=UPI003EBF3EFC